MMYIRCAKLIFSHGKPWIQSRLEIPQPILEPHPRQICSPLLFLVARSCVKTERVMPAKKKKQQTPVKKGKLKGNQVCPCEDNAASQKKYKNCCGDPKKAK